MSLWTRINRFNGGLWSPLLHGRTDLEDYNSALKTCTGFIPLKYGPAERMWGFEYAAEAKNYKSILLPFKFSQSVNYIIETDGTYMRFFDSSQRTIGNAQATVDVANVSDWAIGTTYRYGELARYGNIDATGTISSSGTAITGVGTAFTTEFEVGDYIQEKGNDQVAKITVITDDTNMTVDTTFSPVASGNGFAKVKLWAFDTLGGGANSAIASTGTISSSGTAITGSVLANATGTISSTGTAITGVGTLFESEFQVGEYIQEKGNNQIAKITVITDDTNMTVDTTFSPAASGDNFAKVETKFTTEYLVGDFIKENGNNQVARVVTITDDYNMTVDSTFSPVASADTFSNVSFVSSGWHPLTQTTTAGTYIYEIPLPMSQFTSYLDYPMRAQVNDVVYLVNENYEPLTLSRYGATDWRIEQIEFTLPPVIEQNTSTTTLAVNGYVGTGVTVTASSALFEAGHVGSYWEIREKREAKKASKDLKTAVGPWDSGAIPIFGDWVFTTTGNWAGEIGLYRSIDNFSTEELVHSVSSTKADNFNITGSESNPKAQYKIKSIGTFTNSTHDGLAIITAPAIEVKGSFKITQYTSSTSVTADWVESLDSTAGGAVAATKLWSEGAFSNVQGWPAAVSFYQGRIWFGGTDNRKQTIWGSKIDSFKNFGTSVPNVLASDGVSYTLSSVEQNKIRWFAGEDALLIGTSGEEYSLRGADNNAISATSAPLIQVQSSIGSAYIQPRQVGGGVVFVSPERQRVYELSYDWRARGYAAEDLTRLNAKNTGATGRAYTQIAYSQDPYRILWLPNNGQIDCLVVEKQEEVQAWFEREPNDNGIDKFLSVASVYGSDEDNVWAIYQNSITGIMDNKFQIMRLRSSENTRNYQWFLDAGKVILGSDSEATYPDPDLGSDFTLVTGAEHLGSYSSLTGAVSSSGTTVTGTSTTFTSDLSVGSYIKAGGKTQRVESIASDTSLTTTNAFSPALSGASFELARGRDDVYVLGNGLVLGPYQVHGDRFSVDGEFSAGYHSIIYGVAYPSEIETMKLQAPAGDGMSRNKNKRAVNVGVGFFRTLGGDIGVRYDYEDGQTGENSYEIQFRTPQDNMDTAIPLFTGEKILPLPHGNFRYFSLFYKQTKPLPATIQYMSPQILPKGQ